MRAAPAASPRRGLDAAPDHHRRVQWILTFVRMTGRRGTSAIDRPALFLPSLKGMGRGWVEARDTDRPRA